MGAQLVKEVATKTNDVAETELQPLPFSSGDYREGLKNVVPALTPWLSKGHWKAVVATVDEIKKIAKPIESKSAIRSFALRDPKSANWLPKLWKL